MECLRTGVRLPPPPPTDDPQGSVEGRETQQPRASRPFSFPLLSAAGHEAVGQEKDREQVLPASIAFGMMQPLRRMQPAYAMAGSDVTLALRQACAVCSHATHGLDRAVSNLAAATRKNIADGQLDLVRHLHPAIGAGADEASKASSRSVQPCQRDDAVDRHAPDVTHARWPTLRPRRRMKLCCSPRRGESAPACLPASHRPVAGTASRFGCVAVAHAAALAVSRTSTDGIRSGNAPRR